MTFNKYTSDKIVFQRMHFLNNVVWSVRSLFLLGYFFVGVVQENEWYFTIFAWTHFKW